LPAIVEAYAEERAGDRDDPPDMQRTPTEILQAILPRTFLKIDERLMADEHLAGSTAVVAILTETDIVVANVGDSRGVIYRSNESDQLLRDSSRGLHDSDDVSLNSSQSEDDATEGTDEENDTDCDTDTDTDTDDELDGLAAKSAKKGQQQGAKKEKKKRKYRKKPEEGPVGKIGRWQALSVDHKPNRPDEMERVERCGGRVTKRTNDVWRFQSVLAVSRAFGDRGLKVGSGGAALTANPEIKVFSRQENDKFFVLARYVPSSVLPFHPSITLLQHTHAHAANAVHVVCARIQ
jgi:serine/threonine protein phosphatase PrpC